MVDLAPEHVAVIYNGTIFLTARVALSDYGSVEAVMPCILEWGIKTNVVVITQGILNIPEWYVLMGNWRSYSQNTFSEPTLFSQNKRPNAGKCGWSLG